MSLTVQQRGWVKSAAAASGYPFAVLASLIDKESNGKFYWPVNGKKLIALNIEGHRFYKYLTLYAPEKLERAVLAGLASKQRKGVKVPDSYAGRYEMFERMKALHREAAYMSVSSGVGQIMGENHEAMGFATAEDLFDYGQASPEKQIDLIVRFIQTKPPLGEAVRAGDTKGIGLYYNGPKYRENQYDTKLDALIAYYMGAAPQPLNDEAKRIYKLGYPTVEAFQAENGLTVDGVVGDLTRKKLAEVEKARKGNPAVVPTAVTAAGAVVTGGAVVVAEDPSAVQDVVQGVEPVIGIVQNFAHYGWKVAAAVAVVVIIGVVAYAIWKRTRRVVQ